MRRTDSSYTLDMQASPTSILSACKFGLGSNTGLHSNWQQHTRMHMYSARRPVAGHRDIAFGSESEFQTRNTALPTGLYTPRPQNGTLRTKEGSGITRPKTSREDA